MCVCVCATAFILRQYYALLKRDTSARYFICHNFLYEGNEIGTLHKARSDTCMAARVKGLLLTIL